MFASTQSMILIGLSRGREQDIDSTVFSLCRSWGAEDIRMLVKRAREGYLYRVASWL